MFFKKKKAMRNLEDQRLINMMEELKEQLANLQSIVKNSVDPSEDVIQLLKVTEAKYLFLLKEARERKINMRIH